MFGVRDMIVAVGEGTAYTERTCVYLRIGDRPEYHIGDLLATTLGQINPEEMAALLVQCGEYMQSLVDRELEVDGDDYWRQ